MKKIFFIILILIILNVANAGIAKEIVANITSVLQQTKNNDYVLEINKGFKILTKEGRMLEWFKGQSKPTNNPYALQLNNNALQTKLQSGRRSNH